MSAFDALRDAQAAGALAACQAMGVQIALTHREGTARTIWARILENEGGGSETQFGRQSNQVAVMFRIPLQTYFAAVTGGDARPIETGDKIEYPVSSSRLFYVPNEPDAIQPSPNGAEWIVKAVHERTHVLGQGS